MRSSSTVAERFNRFVLRSDSCWLWTGVLIHNGYGRVTIAQKKCLAHRVAWELEHGQPVPNGKFVLHRCDVRNCVRPSHLFLGTGQDNMDDMRAKGRYVNGRAGVTQCKHGHPYTLENTYIQPAGTRACRTCMSVRSRNRYYQRKSSFRRVK